MTSSSLVDSHPRLAGLRGNRILTPTGVMAGHLRFAGAHISALEPHPDGAAEGLLDAGDLLVLPGIVDLHGDAFERTVMPRPGVTFPYANALHEVDRQLLANGITTEFHGVTLSWEGGLRGEAYAERMFDALLAAEHLLGAHHYVHLRFETHHLAGVDRAIEWIAAGRVRFLALNDHLPSMVRRLGDARKLLQYAERAECDIDTYEARVRRAQEGSAHVPDAMRRLTAAAHASGLRIASHDDPDDAMRHYHHDLGCHVAEFPLTEAVARTAHAQGDVTVFGAPNVVRGRSHTTAPNATAMIRAGLCDILTSDYYYPAPLLAALQLAQQHVLPLAQAWALVSAHPAQAAGLSDRGQLIAGGLADVILVDDSVPGMPRVSATIVNGRLHYASRPWPIGQEIAAASAAAPHALTPA
ncbi:alpha-D-ribose 1-methylphosphonate 5-triphosphate diphosphatase [Schauerella aestuarii]|uniref:alpha-D-ribose 1-methylphosphonate 5-triphosphate diphosphatase n=1 Tax=Schauerella aestuarii TaxID=2511204 RepID=UPI00136E73EC|nr:alpha-D-ribose 1-methylphosphonate 5-triphosphate diphosphatase [Achromobacter aestuarii]MYZ44690.1 alpha-D-ribose 1-methylphosphonate 5-triphosphate diphosphatase [Achromobacter aestuarii]